MKNSIAIGFANKYYTLWNSSFDKTPETWKFNYIKNISMDIEKVKEQYPGVEIDTSLRGTVVWKTPNKTYYTYEPGIFPFGKYTGKKFVEAPIKYLIWFFENFQFEGDTKKEEWWKESSEDLIKIINENGYVTKQFSDYNRVTYDKKNYEFIGKSSLDTLIENNDTLIISPLNNLNENGETLVKNVIFKFTEISEQLFRGFRYYIPLVNGKAKRIKGKEIKITEYDILKIENGPFVFDESTDYYGDPKFKDYDTLTTIIVKDWKFV